MSKSNWRVKTSILNSWPGFADADLEIPGESNPTPHSSNAVAATLERVLSETYSELGLKLPEGFAKLNSPERVIMTTGHQLTLCGGAAFLHHKTITTIAAARRHERETGVPVVPVFWLASEDHDFEEVSWVWGDSQKHVWKPEVSSEKHPVGALSLDGVSEVFESWVGDMPGYPCTEDLEEMRASIIDASSKGQTYAQLFTRWMHSWYGDLGLVVLDASHPELKAIASGLFAAELKGVGISGVLEQNSPAFVRDVNLFYFPANSPRIGIIRTPEGQVMAGETVLNPEGEAWDLWCSSNAAFLSPSVLLRPLYQELLLANAVVVVGPGEMGYWKQLSSAFEHSRIARPTILLRNHVLVVDAAAGAMSESLGWDLSMGWWTEDDFIRAFVDSVLKKDHETSIAKIKSNPEHAYLTLQSLGVKDYALLDALCESGPKQRKASKTAVKKIRQTIKAHNSPQIEAISNTALKLFRSGSPQDRWANFHSLSAPCGGFKTMVEKLVENSYPKGGAMQVVEEEF